MVYLHWMILAVYVVVIVATMTAVLMDNRQPVKTMAWLMVLVFLPVVGIALYFFFGQNIRKERMISQRSMDQLTKRSMLEFAEQQNLHIPENQLPLMRLFANQNFALPFKDNNVEIYTSGYEFFPALLADIARAVHHIHLSTYIIEDDPLGNLVADALIAKAREGVEVRLIYDDVGCWRVRDSFFERLRDNGLDVHSFMPVKFPAFTSKVNYRNHRKIAVIDGEVAYTGGMNIADYYINGLPKIGTWRDMHMRIEGDAVNDLQEIFLTIWNKETKQNIGGEAYFPQHEEQTDSTNIVVAIVDRTPKKNSRMLSHAYAMSIYSAQKNVHIVNPYFVPTSSIKKALNRTIDRGVDVTIMVSSASDIPFTPDAALYKLHKLMKRGATVYMYNGGFHHSKIMMVDDLFCTVGTANLNSRSLRYDYETNAFIFDKRITGELNNMFRNDIEHCTQLTPEFWKKRSPWKKFVGWFANLFTPFL